MKSRYCWGEVNRRRLEEDSRFLFLFLFSSVPAFSVVFWVVLGGGATPVQRFRGSCCGGGG